MEHGSQPKQKLVTAPTSTPYECSGSGSSAPPAIYDDACDSMMPFPGAGHNNAVEARNLTKRSIIGYMEYLKLEGEASLCFPIVFKYV